MSVESLILELLDSLMVALHSATRGTEESPIIRKTLERGFNCLQACRDRDGGRCGQDGSPIMGLDYLGLEVGKRASLVVLAGSPVEALRLRAERLCVIAGGKVVAERAKQETRLSLEGRPQQVSRRHTSSR